MNTVDIPARAAAIYAEGIQPWPVRHNGTKQPRKHGFGIDELPERLSEAETLAMFNASDTGLGIICGDVSGSLELFEFEGRFVNSDDFDTFLSLVEEDEALSGVFARIREGYEVRSPGLGIHLMFKVSDAKSLNNTVLARRPSRPEELEQNPKQTVQVLIETRGTGGFALFAGSNGNIHETGGKWELLKGRGPHTITSITGAERDALYALAESFDEMPPPVPCLGLPGSQAGTGQGWDEIHGWITENIGVDALLIEDGWVLHSQNRRKNSHLWTRPGKNVRDGHSVEVFPDGGIAVYTSTLSEAWVNATLPGKSGGWPHLTPTGLLAAVRFKGDFSAAASWVRLNGLRPAPAPAASAVPANVDPETGEVLSALNLPPEFWDSREVFGHVRQAAHSRGESPDAVLGALIARFATAIPSGYGIPPVVGSAATFDWLSVLTSQSGGGKSSAMKIARELWEGPQYKTIVWDLPAPSGEGLVATFFELKEDEDGGGKKKMVFKKTKNAVLFSVDEAMALVQAGGQRQGSTIASVLCAGWAGQDPGQANASVEKRRIGMVPWSFRMSGLTGIQLSLGWNLLTPAWIEQGLSGRLVFFVTDDVTIPPPKEQPEWPGPIDLPTLPSSRMDLRYATAVVDEVSHLHWEKKVGKRVEEPINGHKMLTRMKLAGIFALMEGRTDVGDEDWHLADLLQTTSIAIRERMLVIRQASVGQENVLAAQSAGYYDGIRQEAAARPAIERGREQILRQLGKGPKTRRQLKDLMSKKDVRKAFGTSLEELEDACKIHCEDGIWKLS